MIIRLHAVITNPEQFISGEYAEALLFMDRVPVVDKWVYLGEVNIAVDVDIDEVRQQAIANVQHEIAHYERLTPPLGELHKLRNALLAQNQVPATDENGDDQWGDESQDDIAREENSYIDSQESRQI